MSTWTRISTPSAKVESIIADISSPSGANDDLEAPSEIEKHWRSDNSYLQQWLHWEDICSIPRSAQCNIPQVECSLADHWNLNANASDYATTSLAVEVQYSLSPEGPQQLLPNVTDAHAPLPGRTRSAPSSRHRAVLPMVFEKTTVLSIPDTGSEENLMTIAFADELGLTVNDAPCHRKEFRLGNGKIITALGRVWSLCSFAKDRSVETMSEFYILGQAIVDVIMGMSFLDMTETLTKHKHRLERLTAPRHGISRLMAMNNPRCRMKCSMRTHQGALEVLSNADTGSEMNLVSSKFVAEQGLLMLERGSESQVQFADGSMAHLAGKTRMKIQLGSTSNRGINWASIVLKFA